MKKISQYIGKSLLTIILLLGYTSSSAQTVTLQPTPSPLVPGQIVVVQIKITADTIAGLNFFINYDKDALTPATPFTENLDPRFSAATTNPNYPSSNPLIGIAYVETFTQDGLPVTLSLESVVSIRFIYNGGSGLLHLRKQGDSAPLSKLFDQYGFQFSGVTYVDATVTGPFGTVYSAASGGLWNNANTWKLTPAGAGTGFVPTGNVNTFVTGSPVTVTANARAKDLTINTAGQLTVNSAIPLTVTGNMLIEGNATGSGSFLNNGTLTVAGTTSFQRWVTSNWTTGFPTASTLWHYVSSPISGATIGTFVGSLLNKWNEPLEQWDTLTIPVSIPLVPGVGYSLAKHAPDGLVTFSGGTLNNNTSYSPIITINTLGSTHGWNLIGNPYSCAISWNALTKSNVFASVYTWNSASGNYVSYNGTAGALTNGILPATQSFFVQALSTTATITIPAASRQHSPTMLYKNTVETLLTMNVKGSNGYEDFAFIHFRPEATVGFDQEYDAYKLFGAETAPQLYSTIPSENLTINSLPGIASQPVIAMGLSVGISDTYTFTASDLETFATGSDIFLEDILLNKVQNLIINPVYIFTASPGDADHRFNIHFAPVGVSENSSTGIKVYSAERTVYVNIPSEMKGNIVVYNMLGIEITRSAIQAYALNKINLDVPTGFYLVKVDGDSSATTGKVFIR